MKHFILLISILFLLSSCFTYKNVTKKEAITHDFLSKLEPGKKYAFRLRTGLTLFIRVTRVEDDRVVGYYYEKKTKNDFSVSFQEIERDVAKISILKLNPYLTGTSIFFLVLTTVTVIWYETSWN
jgi:hypothetical protein